MSSKNQSEYVNPYYQVPKIVAKFDKMTNDHIIIFMHLYEQLRQRKEWNISNPELCILARVSLPTLKRKLNDLESWEFLNRKGMGHNRKFMLGSKFNNRSTSEPDTKSNRLTRLPVLAQNFTSTGSQVDAIKNPKPQKPKHPPLTEKQIELRDRYRHGLKYPKMQLEGIELMKGKALHERIYD
jgi:hypothetical protein